MAKLSALLLACSTLSSALVTGRAVDSYSVAAERLVWDRGLVNSASQLRQGLDNTTGDVPTKLGGSLYWFGNFTVGDSDNLRLLIDTGSTDCILNKGVYKPSKYEQPFKGNKTFEILYEGVNRNGFGFETITGTVQEDIVSSGGLTWKSQAMGNATSWKYIDVPPLPFANPGRGIIGFLGSGASSFMPGAPSWFSNLALHGLLSERRFGLAFGTSGKGQIVIGQVNTSLIDGNFTSVERVATNGSYEGSFTVMGDFTVNGTIFAKDQVIYMDVGTDNIQGPLSVTKQMFDSFGWQTNLKVKPPPPGGFNQGQGESKTLLGYFDCSKPPTIGFSFPATSQLKKGQKATNFNVSTAVWDVYEHKHDAGNCTSILGGINALGNTWLLGQSFFAGHYIDFNIQDETVNYANLKDPSGGS